MTLRLGYFPNITHATALVGVEQGHLRRAPGHERQARDHAPSTPARRPSRRSSPTPSTPPTSARTRPSTPTPSPTARPSGSSPAPPRAAPSSWSSPTSTRPADLKGKKIATPQLGNTQDVALRVLAEGEGPEHRHGGRRRRQHRPAGEQPDPADLQRRRHRRRLGARAVGDPAGPGGRRQGPRRRARPVAGRQVRHHPPDRRPPSSSKDHPDVVKQLLEGQVAANDCVNAEPRRGPDGGQRRASARSPASRSSPRSSRRRGRT